MMRSGFCLALPICCRQLCRRRSSSRKGSHLRHLPRNSEFPPSSGISTFSNGSGDTTRRLPDQRSDRGTDHRMGEVDLPHVGRGTIFKSTQGGLRQQKSTQPSFIEAKDILQPNQILNRPDLETTCNLILTAEIPAIIGIPELSSPFALIFATGKINFQYFYDWH